MRWARKTTGAITSTPFLSEDGMALFIGNHAGHMYKIGVAGQQENKIIWINKDSFKYEKMSPLASNSALQVQQGEYVPCT